MVIGIEIHLFCGLFITVSDSTEHMRLEIAFSAVVLLNFQRFKNDSDSFRSLEGFIIRSTNASD